MPNKATKASKSKKKPKGATFVQSQVTAPGIRYGGKDVYSMKITANNARYTDMYEHVKLIQNKLKSKFPNAKMNVAIKYQSMSKPISAGYFSVADDPDVKAVYDYADEDDTIEHFYISFTK